MNIAVSSSNSRIGFWRRQKRATRVIRQTGNAHCFEAVVQMLCAHYRLPIVAGAEIREAAGTTKRGTSATGAKNCLERIGFFVNIGQCTYKQLGQLTAPAIAVVNRIDGALHYVLINRARRGRIDVLDPGSGLNEKHKKKDFEQMWTGVLILVSPKTDAALNMRFERNPIRIILGMLSRRKVQISLVVLAALMQTVMLVSGLVLLREFLKSLSHQNQRFHVFGVLLGFFICAFFRTLFLHCYEWIRYGIKRRTSMSLELQATEHIQRLNAICLSSSDSTELAQRSVQDPQKIGQHFVSLVDALAQFVVLIGLIGCAGILVVSAQFFVSLSLSPYCFRRFRFSPISSCHVLIVVHKTPSNTFKNCCWRPLGECACCEAWGLTSQGLKRFSVLKWKAISRPTSFNDTATPCN